MITVFVEYKEALKDSVENPGGDVVIVSVTPGSDKQIGSHGTVAHTESGPTVRMSDGNFGGNGHSEGSFSK